jgi:hypothetical protein
MNMFQQIAGVYILVQAIFALLVYMYPGQVWGMIFLNVGVSLLLIGAVWTL